MVRVNGVQHEVVVNGESMARGKESEESNPDVPAYVREVLNNAGVVTWAADGDSPV